MRRSAAWKAVPAVSKLRLAYAMEPPTAARAPAVGEVVAEVVAEAVTEVVAEVGPEELQPAARALFPDYRTDDPSIPAGTDREGTDPDGPDRSPGEAERTPGGEAGGAGSAGVHVVLVRRGDGYEISTPDGVHSARDAAEALARWELALAKALLATTPRLLHLHAGAVRTRSGILALPGEAGAGKSTLTLALAARGLPVLGDDIVLVDPEDGRVLPFKRLLKADARALEVAGVVRPDPGPLAQLWPEVELLHPSELGSSWADPGSVSRVLFPKRYRDAGPPRIEALGSADALRRLLEFVVSDDVPGAREFQILADAVSGAELAELHYARGDEAAAFLQDG